MIEKITKAKIIIKYYIKRKQFIYGIQKDGTDEPICKAHGDAVRDLWTQRGKERVGRIERVALKHMHYHM